MQGVARLAAMTGQVIDPLARSDGNNSVFDCSFDFHWAIRDSVMCALGRIVPINPAFSPSGEQIDRRVNPGCNCTRRCESFCIAKRKFQMLAGRQQQLCIVVETCARCCAEMAR